MKKSNIHIGTSGWQYKHWKGRFYPKDLKAKEEFNYYCKLFNTVELNNSFYRLPESSSFTKWRKVTPANFVFSVKASRFITHMKKLSVDKASIRQFFTRAGKLKEKAGPVLFQLPPRWKINITRLEEFLGKLPRGQRYTFEFRDHSWYDEKIYSLLREYKCAFCIYELEHHLSPLVVTADFVYVRLHGPGNKYQGNYSLGTLKSWAMRCSEWRRQKKDVYVYFDNDQEGYAAFNAQRLKQLISKRPGDKFSRARKLII
jgi:uncharacterized protein YecE (DUF72 family)